jgi:hypothetical protein
LASQIAKSSISIIVAVTHNPILCASVGALVEKTMKASGSFEEIQPIEHDSEMQAEGEEFYPKGAIAFFVSMLIGFGIIWGALYMVMVHRALHL